jgi:malonyl-CoA O-methyltransferase
VLFSSYGPDALRELCEACKRSLPLALRMPNVDMHDFGDMIVAAGFEALVTEVDTFLLSFGGPRQLID